MTRTLLLTLNTAFLLRALLVAALVAGTYALFVPAIFAQAKPCGVYSIAYNVPTGYGVAFNVYSLTREVPLQSMCDTAGFSATIGSSATSPTNFAVYNTGYRWDGSKWVAYTLVPNGGSASGSYVMGNAKSGATLAYTGEHTYWVSFACVLKDGAWKCGCRDEYCQTPYWNLQVAYNPPAATPPATGGGGSGGGDDTGGGGATVSGCNNLKIGQLGVGKAINMVVPVIAAKPSSKAVPAHFNWSFNSGGGDAYCGKFANGDYWIAPKDGTTVQITDLTTNNSKVGLDADPVMESTGLLTGYGNYNAGQNLMLSLPVSFSKTTSLVAAKHRNQSATNPCGTQGILNGCIDAYHIVTVLPSVPVQNGGNMIRPNITGQAKVSLTLAEFDFSRLPNSSFLTGTNAAGLEVIRTRWSHSTGVFELNFPNVWVGEAGRAWRPHIAHDDYGAGMAEAFNRDLMVIFSSANSLEQKTPALAAMISWGLDMYHARYHGPADKPRGWTSGAGQHPGHFLPPVLAAALLKDPAYASVLKQVGPTTHAANYINRGPSELRQISLGVGGVPLWGDMMNDSGGSSPATPIRPSPEEERRYWWNLFNAQCYLNAPGTCNVGGSNNAIRSRSLRDAYGYHDAAPRLVGDGYIRIALGSQRALAAAMCLMPEIREIVNYPPLLQYLDRAQKHGVWAKPDPCAAPPANEKSNCDPMANNGLGANCNYYRKTWGPDPKNPGQCIKNNVGRWAASRHGVALTPLYAVPQVESNWTAIRALCK